MKNFLKKLHMVPSHEPEDVDPAPDPHKQPPLSTISNWLNSVTNKHPSHSRMSSPLRGQEAGASSAGSSSDTVAVGSGRMRRLSVSTVTPPTGAEVAGSSMSSSSVTVGSERMRRESGSGAVPSTAAPELPLAEVPGTTPASAPVATEEDDLEDYQLQLALELSAREDPEAVQIEVAKQISLGSCPVESTPAEVIAYRYWVSATSNRNL
jgi:hypothetical protein